MAEPQTVSELVRIHGSDVRVTARAAGKDVLPSGIAGARDTASIGREDEEPLIITRGIDLGAVRRQRGQGRIGPLTLARGAIGAVEGNRVGAEDVSAVVEAPVRGILVVASDRR